VLAHDFHRLAGLLEGLGAGVEVRNAALQPVVAMPVSATMSCSAAWL
jgi:hypothetical protein